MLTFGETRCVYSSGIVGGAAEACNEVIGPVCGRSRHAAAGIRSVFEGEDHEYAVT